MNQIIEVIYEDDVLKPLTPIEGLRKNERALVIIYPKPDRKALHALVGTLTHEEAEEMRRLIDGEFERVESEW